MKVVLPDLAGSADLAERFIREIRIQARLAHPNIAALHNALRFENQLLMIMEYVDGMALSSRLRHGKIDPALSIEILLQVLAALQYAHALGVIHRDVKPANIMVAKGGVVKLMDFGIARSSVDASLTQSGNVLGSSYYMSPEQVKGEIADSRSDIYSAGIVLYEMITGLKPITGPTTWSVMNHHLSQPPIAPAALDPALPLSLSTAVLKALEKDPASRFANTAEFAESIKNARNQISLAPPVDKELMAETLPLASQLKSTSNPIGASTPSIETKVFSREELDAAKRDLAACIGPMARIIVDRAAKKTKNLKALYELIAEEVPPGRERASFLAKRPQ